MPNSTNLGLPYIDANQNQKYVTHNTALQILDALVQIQVQSASLTAPPASPSDGQAWIVGAGATGAWFGKDLQIAAWQSGAWAFYPPRPGYIAYNLAASTALLWNGTAWGGLAAAFTTQQLSALGIGTAPDSGNPLSVTANTALFSAKPTGAGGSGDMRVKLGKASAGNTASLLLQDGTSGRAEIGLAGDDNLHIKVSPDGSTWYDALDIAGATGTVSFLSSPVAPTPSAGDNSTRAATTAFVAASFVTYAYATANYAPLANPALTGTPTAPTPTQNDNSAKLATTAYADRAAAASNLTRKQVSDVAYTILASDRIVAVVALTAARTLTLPAASAYPPGATLTVVDESGACSAGNTIVLTVAGTDTINGAASAAITTAYGYLAIESNGANKWTVVDAPAIVTSVAGRAGAVTLGVADVAGAAPLAGPALTGTPNAPTPAAGDNSTRLATTSFVAASFVTYAYATANYAPLANPTLTGTPTAPTPAQNDNSTKLATTAYADRAAAASNLTRKQVSDAAYTILTTDRIVAVVAITAARTLTLPAASAFPQGAALTIVDESGACSPTTSLIIAAAGTDTINGTANASLAYAYAYVAIESNGANKWTIVDQAVPPAAPGGFLNRFRNGTMDVWQRGTSMTVATTGAYAADGWIVVPTGAACTATQVGGRQTTKNSLQVTGASGVTDIIVKQRIESLMAAALAGQTVSVQAQVYNNTGAAISPTLTVKRPTAQDNYASTATDVNTVALQSCAAGAWTQVAYTFAANAASYNGLEISFDFGNNFSTSSSKIQLAELDIRVTPSVAPGLNGAPPPPELRPAGAELLLCKRYYESSFQLGVTPAPAAGISCAVTFGQIVAGGTNQMGPYVPLMVEKRATPTVTTYNPVNGNAQVYNGGGAGDWASTTVVNPGLRGFSFSGTPPSGAGAGGVSYLHYAANADL